MTASRIFGALVWVVVGNGVLFACWVVSNVRTDRRLRRALNRQPKGARYVAERMARQLEREMAASGDRYDELHRSGDVA